MTAHSDGIDDQVRIMVAARLGVPVETVTLETQVEIEIAPPGAGGLDDPLLTQLARRFGTVFQHPVESRSALGVVLREAFVYPTLGCGFGLLWDLSARESGLGWRLVLLAGFLGFGTLSWLLSRAPKPPAKPFRRKATVRRLAAAVRNGLM
jgi:hypothetical protein